jgi:alkylhydroperoxidase/carboxymuconolactone decarboxylase family protein YurZ
MPSYETEIAKIAPEVAAGYAQIRAAIEADGALSATWKALICAVCASVCGENELAERELARGRSIGLDDGDIGVAGVALLLARGETKAQRFIDLAGGLVATPEPRPASSLAAEDYFRDYLGVAEIPPRMAIMRDQVPEVFEGYHRMHHGALAADPSITKLSESIMVAVNAAQLQPGFIAIHAATARKAGASDAELVEAVVCAVSVSGVAAWASGAEALFPTP